MKKSSQSNHFLYQVELQLWTALQGSRCRHLALPSHSSHPGALMLPSMEAAVRLWAISLPPQGGNWHQGTGFIYFHVFCFFKKYCLQWHCAFKTNLPSTYMYQKSPTLLKYFTNNLRDSKRKQAYFISKCEVSIHLPTLWNTHTKKRVKYIPKPSK